MGCITVSMHGPPRPRPDTCLQVQLPAAWHYSQGCCWLCTSFSPLLLAPQRFLYISPTAETRFTAAQVFLSLNLQCGVDISDSK